MALILVINSKSGLAHAVATALETAGYQVLIAKNAEDAAEQLNGKRPGLILLGDTGYSMFQQTGTLKSNLLTRDVPIMLQSDDFRIFSLAYQQRLGVQAVLNSSYSTTQLITTVKTVVSNIA